MDPDVGQPYLLDLPFQVDLVERDGWRFEITFDAEVAEREPERIAAFVSAPAAEGVGAIVPHSDGRTILTRGRVSIVRMDEAVLRAWATVGGRIRPPAAPLPDRTGR